MRWSATDRGRAHRRVRSWGAQPSVPAYLVLAGCAGAAALLTQWPGWLAVLVWVLLGVSAGYSISGSP